jgi:hypothetical protein
VAAEEITLGELGRRMASMDGTLKEGLRDLSTKVDARPTHADLELVKTTLGVRLDSLEARVTKGEGWGTWGNRLVLAALSVAVLGTVVKPPG